MNFVKFLLTPYFIEHYDCTSVRSFRSSGTWSSRFASVDPIGDTRAIFKSFRIYLDNYDHPLDLMSPRNYQILIVRGLENVQMSTNKTFQISLAWI